MDEPVIYTEGFFDHITAGSKKSAEIVLPGLLATTGAELVVDVGCGTGAWLSVAKACGCRVHGVDGFVPDAKLLIDADEFQRAELGAGVGCGGFDLAMCLEVAEHLPETAAATLVAGLCGASWVLFSAAIPGQGGVSHVNEQWSTYWAALFAEAGYVGSCDLRWQHWNDRRVENWYRQNMLVFAHPDDLHAGGFTEGVVDVVHPERLGIWP